MLSFKEYINEAPIRNDITKEIGLEPYDDFSSNRKYISKLKDHLVSHFKDGIHGHYALHEPKTGKISLGLSVKHLGDKTHVENLNGFGNKIPAHEFYHHLITEHGLHLHSDYSLSRGAEKVWKKLHQMPNIHMQAYDMKNRTYTDIPKHESLDKYMDKPSFRFAAKKVTNVSSR